MRSWQTRLCCRSFLRNDDLAHRRADFDRFEELFSDARNRGVNGHRCRRGRRPLLSEVDWYRDSAELSPDRTQLWSTSALAWLVGAAILVDLVRCLDALRSRHRTHERGWVDSGDMGCFPAPSCQ